MNLLSHVKFFYFRLDDGQANGADDQYDVADYDKEPQKNDIHLAEGEDEGEGDTKNLTILNNRSIYVEIILTSEFQMTTCSTIRRI